MISEAELAELMGRMRLLEADHMPDDWPAVKMEDITALCDEVVARSEAGALHLLARIREALGDNGTRMQADLIAYCAELRDAKAHLASAVEVAGKAGVERDRFRTALEYIRAKLSSTPIAGDAWVGELHQRLFVVAHNDIN